MKCFIYWKINNNNNNYNNNLPYNLCNLYSAYLYKWKKADQTAEGICMNFVQYFKRQRLSSPGHEIIYIYLVFTRSVDSNFRAFWLAAVTRNILGYSLFCERREKWRVVSRTFQKKKIKQHFFIHLIWSVSVKSGGYIPRRFASRYISTTIHLPFGG